ncbi:hypothetical protein ACFL2K_02280 [Candidatus Margulisiibacteriota bacterium]
MKKKQLRYNSSEYFEKALKTYKKAELKFSKPIKKYFQLGNMVILVSFAGPELVSYLMPAFEHVMCAPVLDPHIEIYCFDSESTKVQLPKMPWSEKEYLINRDVPNSNKDIITAIYSAELKNLNLINDTQNKAIFWTNSSSNLPYYIKGAPLIRILTNCNIGKNNSFIHASAVGTENDCVLFVGESGSGKSTSALTCLNSKLNYLSDDFCFISLDPKPYAHSLFNAAKLEKDNLNNFPFLRNKHVNNDSDPKYLYLLNTLFPEKMTKKLPIKAIFVPQINNSISTTIEPTSPMTALKAIAPTTILQLSAEQNSLLTIFSKLVQKVPCYNLKLGSDLEQIPKIVSKYLL